ncbi:MAG: hypothetical protein ACFB0Z_13680 [Candidatus Phaeomarinobacter sp.]
MALFVAACSSSGTLQQVQSTEEPIRANSIALLKVASQGDSDSHKLWQLGAMTFAVPKDRAVGRGLVWIAPGAEHLLEKDDYKFWITAEEIGEAVPGYQTPVGGQSGALMVSIDTVSERDAALGDELELQAELYWPHRQYDQLKITRHPGTSLFSVKGDASGFENWLLFASDPSPLQRRDYSPLSTLLGTCYFDWPDEAPLCQVYFVRNQIAFWFEVLEPNWKFIPQLRDFAESILLSWSVSNPE